MTTDLEVRFIRINVTKIDDPGINAEAEFTLKVNGQTRTFADRNLGLGSTPIGASFTVSVPDTSVLGLQVSGIERDTLTADDPLPGFTRSFGAAQGFGVGTHTVSASNPHMTYTMEFDVRKILKTNLTGTATLTTTSEHALGPFSLPVTIGLSFNADRTKVKIVSFPPITLQTDNGPVVVSLAGPAEGPFTKSTGAISLPVRLLFDLPIVANSELPLTLTTGSAGGVTGSPLNSSTRAVRLVGSGPFDGGFLDDEVATLTVQGTLGELP